ncbi:methyltransferase domain-containing protein [Candidatus Falkowbacteria bacterium]|nr:methyltransferase domain-containing protein [Candidatus Falkowbacteria bacterium]
MDKQTEKNLLYLVKRNYEEIAEDFDTTRKKQLWPELIKLAGMVKDGDRALDVGCGNGRLAEAFSEKNIEYIGVDSSKKLVEAARKNFPDSRLPTCLPDRLAGQAGLRGNDGREWVPRNDNGSYKFQIADILELDKLPEKDFDYIFCIAVLHHLPGDDLRIKALKQIKNKLKPGGKIVLTVWNLWSRPKFRKLILKYAFLKIIGLNKMDFGDILFAWKNNKGEKISQRYYHAFSKNELKKLAARAEFKIEKLYQDKYNYYLILEK